MLRQRTLRPVRRRRGPGTKSGGTRRRPGVPAGFVIDDSARFAEPARADEDRRTGCRRPSRSPHRGAGRQPRAGRTGACPCHRRAPAASRDSIARRSRPGTPVPRPHWRHRSASAPHADRPSDDSAISVPTHGPRLAPAPLRRGRLVGAAADIAGHHCPEPVHAKGAVGQAAARTVGEERRGCVAGNGGRHGHAAVSIVPWAGRRMPGPDIRPPPRSRPASRSLWRPDGLERVVAAHRDMEVRPGQVAEAVRKPDGGGDGSRAVRSTGAWRVRTRLASSPMVTSHRSGLQVRSPGAGGAAGAVRLVTPSTVSVPFPPVLTSTVSRRTAKTCPKHPRSSQGWPETRMERHSRRPCRVFGLVRRVRRAPRDGRVEREPDVVGQVRMAAPDDEPVVGATAGRIPDRLLPGGQGLDGRVRPARAGAVSSRVMTVPVSRGRFPRRRRPPSCRFCFDPAAPSCRGQRFPAPGSARLRHRRRCG